MSLKSCRISSRLGISTFIPPWMVTAGMSADPASREPFHRLIRALALALRRGFPLHLHRLILHVQAERPRDPPAQLRQRAFRLVAVIIADPDYPVIPLPGCTPLLDQRPLLIVKLKISHQ